MNKNLFWIIPIVVMGIGFFQMPYGYYNLLRVIVCGCSAYFAYNLFQKKDSLFAVIFCGIAVLYNPIAPVYLYDKGLWMIINVITAVLLFMKKDALTEDESED